MSAKQFEFFSPNEIEPTGWLRRQLEIQAEGLSGHLHEVWPDIRDSAWIGGNHFDWERVPYWLDGFIPLAYLLKDEKLIATARRYVDSILSLQKPDGRICPCSEEELGNYDIWPLFLICKVFTVYAACSGETERMEDATYKALKSGYTLLSQGKVKLENWSQYRWFECFISLSWLYQRRHEDWIPAFGRLLEQKGIDYETLYSKWETPLNTWTYYTHIVNIAMALKAEAMTAELLDKPYTGYADRMQHVLDKYNGTAVGLFTGDECLSGLSPIQGTELCAVVEQMYSYECLLAYTGQTRWADKLERLAYNALPAAVSADMWTHQYVQMANQISCMHFDNKPIFRTNGCEANMFGLEPNFGCCTANFNQGWPKFALSAFMKSRRGIVSAVLAPATLHTTIRGVNVHIALGTDYPFRKTAVYHIHTDKPVRFDFALRIPTWAETAEVNGNAVKKKGFYHITKEWSGNETISVRFTATPRLVTRPYSLKALNYGPFLMALPLEAEWNKVEYTRDGTERRFPYCDYNVSPKSDWNYAFCPSDWKVIEHEIGEYPFSETMPPIQIIASMQKIDWGYEDGYVTVCRKTPKSHKTQGEAVILPLQPYGCTKLRMTEMPLLGPKK